MSQPFNPEDPAPAEPSSGCSPWILGCALGCGALIVLSFVAVAITGWWFVRPGEQHPTTAAVGSESLGAFRVADLGQDEGIREALGAIVRETSRLSPPPSDSERPFWVRSDDPEAMANLFARLLPREGTVAFEPVPGTDEPAAVLVLNLRGMTRPLRMILESDHERREVHRNVPIAGAQGGDTSFAMVDGTLVVSDHAGAVRDVIDRILDRTAAPLSTSFEVLEPPTGSALSSGATTFERGTLSESLRGEDEDGEPPPIDPSTLDGVTRLELVVDQIDAETIRLRIGLGADSPASASTAAAAMADLLRARMAPATVRFETATAGSTATLEAEVGDWVAPFAAWLVRLEDSDDRPAELERTGPVP